MRNTNTRNTAKATKTNKNFIASICAVIAAAATITSVAVFTASARTIKDSTTSSSVSTTVKEQQTTQTAKETQKTTVQQQAAPQAEQQETPQVEQQAAPQVEQQAAPQVEQQAAPQVEQQAAPQVEQQAAPQAEQQAAPQVKQQAAPQAEQQNKVLTVPQGEINDWKTHDAKDGFPIGTYFDKNNANNTLNVSMVNSYTYSITITLATGENTATVYNITATANGSKMYYNSAAETSLVYDGNGSVIDSKIISNDHKGTFDASDAGYTWTDTQGTMIFTPWVGYPYSM